MARKSMSDMGKDMGQSMGKTSEEIGSKYGALMFLGGMALAFLIGAFSSFLPVTVLPFAVALLVLLGLAVGLFNISDTEMDSFLIGAVALVISSTALTASLEILGMQLAGIPGAGLIFSILIGFISKIVFFVGPAAGVVALKAIYRLARDR